MTFHTSVIELSRSALKRNLGFFRRLVGPDCRLSCVVKANAYGHGIPTFVPLAEECGADHFTVFSASEARAVLCASEADSRIMITGHIEDDLVPWAIENRISFYVFELGRLASAIDAARQGGQKAAIHLQLETGMNRTGFREPELSQAVEMIRNNLDVLDVAGICTHFAGAESVNNYLRVNKQIERFEELSDRMRAESIPFRARHAACSAAAINYPQTRMDMVRLGIAMYGFWPTMETKVNYQIRSGGGEGRKWRDPLRRVMRWKTRIIALKEVPKGEFIGYGTSRLATRRTRVGVVPIGYYHGFSRSLSNLGHVLVNGRRVDVAGLVNMNMMLIDVSQLGDNVARGDEVVIIGRQKHGHITVQSFSNMTSSLNYEVLVRLPSEIPRTVVP